MYYLSIFVYNARARKTQPSPPTTAINCIVNCDRCRQVAVHVAYAERMTYNMQIVFACIFIISNELFNGQFRLAEKKNFLVRTAKSNADNFFAHRHTQSFLIALANSSCLYPEINIRSRNRRKDNNCEYFSLCSSSCLQFCFVHIISFVVKKDIFVSKHLRARLRFFTNLFAA